MNIFENGIIHKIFYPNTITEKPYKPLTCGKWELGGHIQSDNIHGGHIVKGATKRAGTLT